MDYFVIRGGQRLEGDVEISGAKNAALPIMAACVMGDAPIVLRGVPRLTDTDCMATLLRELGCRVHRGDDLPANAFGRRAPVADPDALFIDPSDHDAASEAPGDLVASMRASISVLGPLLARRGRAVVPMPGGCKFGTRPIDLHLRGLERLGASFELHDGCVIGTVPGGRLRGTTMYLGGTQGPTVLGTINIMSAAALADGVTRIVGAACEPEVADCADLLNKMGARISGHGTPTITIEGVERLGGCDHRIIPDRIEAGTFMIAAAISGGRLTLKNAEIDHLVSFTHLLEGCGVEILPHRNGDIEVAGTGRAKPTDTATWPYPGFPTDLQAQLMALLCLADGNSVISERIYPERFAHADEMNRLGANIRRSSGVAIITGVDHLVGATVTASDLRASAGLILAGLVARGTTVVEQIRHVDRGYERIEEKLQRVGAKIERAVQKPKISVAINAELVDSKSKSESIVA